MTLIAPPPPTPRHWDVGRSYALVAGPDWARCTATDVAPDPNGGGVALARRLAEPGVPAAMAGAPCAIAVDRTCRLYLGDRDRGVVLSVARPTEADAADRAGVFLGARALPGAGDFQAAERTGLLDPVAMAVDPNDRLFVLDRASGSVLIVDLWQRRVVERIPIGSPAEPTRTAVDLAVGGDSAWVLLDGPPAVARIEARELADVRALDPDLRPVRLAAAPGGLLAVLSREGRIHLLDGSPAIEVPGATDLAFEPDDRLVVGRGPGADLVELRRIDHVFAPSGSRRGHRYPGCGLVLVEHGRVGYWDGTRLRRAAPAPDRFVRRGQVTTVRLDSGRFQGTWGRLFLDACIPRDTRVLVTAHTSDDPAEPGAAPVAWQRRPVLRRAEGRELAWDRGSPPLETFEAPVLAAPGRYLWLRLDLEGNSFRSPQLVELRVESTRHALLDKLPAVFSAEPDRADFLGRYLAMAEGVLHDLDVRATLRHLLFDPHATPAEALDWLSSIVGLTQDQRWSQASRRTLLAEIVGLFRRRGTIGSLTRMIEIYLGLGSCQAPPAGAPDCVQAEGSPCAQGTGCHAAATASGVTVLEHFRLRGVAGQLLGDTTEPPASSVLGGGFRVGGSLGEPALADAGSADPYAHRFTVVIPVPLTAEQREVIDHLLEVHRPAHTLVEVCALDAGMRVGRGLHLQISSVIGHTGGFATYVVGDALLGRGSILGRPVVGARAGSGRVGSGRVG